MKVSVIIPVWNGESVVAQCLEAVFAHSEGTLLEVVCVDNASQDESAAIITDQFPQVRLLYQPVNLGFAGGVNAGITAAHGDVFVLLNQDCLPHKGWLTAITHTFAQNPHIGIVGGTIYSQDGTVNHAGAHIRHPDGFGEHATAVPSQSTPQIVDYVNGAVFAIRREVWEKNGRFDDEFYPGYFEESDYCYRARQNGYQTAYAPEVKATHLFSSREWKKDPLKHSANQHRSRYRFIAKHFSITETKEFFAAETAVINQRKEHPDQTLGRALAARDSLRALDTIAAVRQRHLNQSLSPAHKRLLGVGFTRILRQTLSTAPSDDALQTQIAANRHTLQNLRDQEYDLLAKIHFRHPTATESEPRHQRWWRLLILRPLSILSLRDYFLQSKLNDLQTARLDQTAVMQQLLNEQTNSRLRLLQHLADYEYR